jgi:origin recognition complex subunit 4
MHAPRLDRGNLLPVTFTTTHHGHDALAAVYLDCHYSHQYRLRPASAFPAAAMDDSPRLSKRRRLETSKAIEARQVEEELAKTTTATGKRAARSVPQPANASVENTAEETDGQAPEQPAPTRRGRPPKSSTIGSTNEAVEKPPSKRTARPSKNTTKEAAETPAPKRRGRPPKSAAKSAPAPPAVTQDKDIFDDIEGALGVQSPIGPSIKSTDGATGERPEASKAPKRGGARSTKNVQSTGRSASKPAAKGRKRGTDAELDGQEESSLSKPQSARKTAATRKRAVSKDKTPSTVTPLKPTKRSKPARQLETIPDIEDEDENGDHDPPSSRKKAASTRRRSNRADHTHNRDDDAIESVVHEIDDSVDEMDIDGDSLVGSVLDPTEPSPFNKPPSAQKEPAPPPLIYGNIAAGRELNLLKSIVMDRIAGKRPSPLVGLDEEYKSVHQLVEHTITAGEGNSMLVIGARGSGKSALVKKVLSEISKDHGDDYYVVRLNGFIHTDDKIALRDIWRQLGKEMDVEEDGSGPGKNYADTLTTLLALLSHPSEQTGEVTDQVAKAVIFIMDEFDLFAQHPRQTLLYNLFDIAQSRKAPIAVLGLTTRIDVTDSLEKRVKSRFSHRYVHLSLAKTFTAYQEICQACLTVQPDQLSVEERGMLEGGTKTTPAKKDKQDTKQDTNQDVLAEWNANIEVSVSSTPLTQTLTQPETFHIRRLHKNAFSTDIPPNKIHPHNDPILPPPYCHTLGRSSLHPAAPRTTRLKARSDPASLDPRPLPPHRRRAPRHHP